MKINKTGSMDIKKLIGEATEYDKKEMLESKRPKSWLKSVSAFANGMGGKLLFGIDDDGEVVGLADCERDCEIISETIKTKMDPIPEIHLVPETVDGKKIIVLTVFPGKETPYYYIGDGNRQAFVRIGNESVIADRTAIRRLVLKGAGTPYDSLPSPFEYKNMAFTKLRSVCKQRTHNDFLDTDYESWGIINENGELTNAGALIADESPVRHSRVFCTRWNGLTKAPGLLDAVDDAEYSGSIISLLQEAIAFVARNSKKAWMKLPDDRQEMPEYPERAVLESVVNALIHRDYLEYGSEVHIDMFDDRLEIYSPGGMMDGTMVQNLDVLNVPSRRRNPVIADIFNRLHYMDRRGSGFKKIVEDYQMYANVSNGAKPVFKSELSSFFITLPNLQYVVKGQDGTKDVTKDVIKDVTKEHDDILDVMRDNPNVTTAEMSQRIGLTQRHILRLIKELTDKEVIRRDGGRRYGKWMILKEYRGKDSE